jgi:hypothetical protein
MPNEPERDIEKKLKAYAKQRRDEAGASRPMHPATRKMLRDEALRIHSPMRHSATFWEKFWHFRQRFALAGGVIVLVGIAAWIMVPDQYKREGKQKREMYAMSSAASPAQPTLASAPASAPIPAPEMPAQVRDKSERSDMALDRVQSANKAPQSQTLDANAPAAPPAVAEVDKDRRAPTITLSDSLTVATNASLATRNEPGAAPPSPLSLAPAAPPPVAYDEASTTATFAATQLGSIGGGGGFGANNRIASDFATEKFKSVNGVAAAGTVLKKADAVTVLSTFKVERTNGQIRVIDSDGSIYSGIILAGTPPSGAVAAQAKHGQSRMLETQKESAAPAGAIQADAAKSPMPGPAQGIAFSVSGTNLSLNRSILFTGNWLPAEPATVTAGATSQVAGAGGKLQVNQAVRRAPSARSRVLGRVIIGGTNELDVNAEATKQ